MPTGAMSGSRPSERRLNMYNEDLYRQVAEEAIKDYYSNSGDLTFDRIKVLGEIIIELLNAIALVDIGENE